MLFLQSLKNTYLRLPMWIKAPVGMVPPSVILGKHYRRQARFLHESLQWSAEEFAKFQLGQLLSVTEFAATTVPYYRDLFARLGLPKKLRSIDEFLMLPFLTKEIIKEEGGRLVSEAIPVSSRYKVTTGGTSGTPMAFWMAAEAYGREWAFVHDLLARYGISSSDRKIGLRGVPFPRAEHGIYYQFNPIYRELQISPFHLTEDVIKNMASLIRNFGARYIHGYPSSVSQFASIVSKCGLAKELDLKGVLLVSETVYPHQLTLISEALGCPVISFYGHSERLIFAGSAPDREGYFIDPRYGFTEAIDGELVGTGFINKAMPMLRYRTGDYATIEYPVAGNGAFAFPRIPIVDGRWLQEMLVGKNGALISITALNMHSDLFANVQRFQFYQESPGKVELRVIPTRNFEYKRDGEVIKNAFREKVSHELDIELKVVDSVELTVRGKQMFLIQKLHIGVGNA